MKEVIWIDGKLTKKRNAVISVFDHGFLYGDGLFETMRAYRGRVFRLDDHLARLFSAAHVLKLRMPHSRTFFKKTIIRMTAGMQSTDAYVRVAVTRGKGPLGLDPLRCRRSTAIILAKPFKGYPASFYAKGAKVCIASIKRDHTSPVSRLKSMNYLAGILAVTEAKQRKKDDAILLNTDGFVAEATTSNVFVVKKGTVSTPRIHDGVLPGVTRKIIVQLARRTGLNVVEKRIRVAELQRADEIFLTSSIVEVRGVIELDGLPIAGGAVGPVTRSLHRLYRKVAEGTTRN